MRNWSATYGGHTWTQDDLTAGDCCAIQQLAGGGFECLDPFAGPLQMASMIAAVYGRLTDNPPMIVFEQLRTMPAAAMVDAVEPVD